MVTPLLSIIIPVYNLGNIIQITLSRLISQSTGNEEIIIVDDGSIDETLKVCRAFDNYEYIKIIHKENGGQSSARNLGLRYAKGKYVWFFDGDDDLVDNSFSLLNEYILNLTNFDIAIFDYLSCYEDGAEITHKTHFPETKSSSNSNGLNVLSNEGAIPVWRAIFNRQFLTRNGLIFEEGILHEDFEFSIRAYALAKLVKYIPYTLYRYRCQRAGSTTNVFRAESPIGYAYSAITLWKFIERNSFNEKEIQLLCKVVSIGISFSFERLTHIQEASLKK